MASASLTVRCEVAWSDCVWTPILHANGVVNSDRILCFEPEIFYAKRFNGFSVCRNVVYRPLRGKTAFLHPVLCAFLCFSLEVIKTDYVTQPHTHTSADRQHTNCTDSSMPKLLSDNHSRTTCLSARIIGMHALYAVLLSLLYVETANLQLLKNLGACEPSAIFGQCSGER